MWILNINDAWKNLVKYLKTENFQFRLIEHQLNANRVRQIQIRNFIAISISRATDSIDWKFGKINFLKKQSILMQKLLKAQCFTNKMYEYEMKSFSKTLEFNPDLPKTRFSINLSSKTQTLSTFCIKIKEILILDDHNKITHNIMYKV